MSFIFNLLILNHWIGAQQEILLSEIDKKPLLYDSRIGLDDAKQSQLFFRTGIPEHLQHTIQRFHLICHLV